MSREELIALLKEVVSLESNTTSEYTGGDPAYENVTTVSLVIDGEAISTFTIKD